MSVYHIVHEDLPTVFANTLAQLAFILTTLAMWLVHLYTKVANETLTTCMMCVVIFFRMISV